MDLFRDRNWELPKQGQPVGHRPTILINSTPNSSMPSMLNLARQIGAARRKGAGRVRALVGTVLTVLALGLTSHAGELQRPGPTCSTDTLSRGSAKTEFACIQNRLDALHLNEIQFVGTAESYKLRPSAAVLSLITMGSAEAAKELDYEEPPISVQLSAGARSLEFDIAYDPKGGMFEHPAGALMAMELVSDGYVAAMATPGFKVIHILDIDFNSSCVVLNKCLAAVADWSRSHPNHLPIVIVLKTNDERTPMPGATRPAPFDTAAFDKLDLLIRSIFKKEELITPDMVMGKYVTLRDAILAHSWPTIGAARGKVIFLLDDAAPKVAMYRGKRHSLEGRVMFVSTDRSSPAAGFITFENPLKSAKEISSAVKAGFIVHTFADADTKEARSNSVKRRDTAFDSGAQIVSTDFLVPDRHFGAYQVHIPGGQIARCDPQIAAQHCEGHDVESGAPVTAVPGTARSDLAVRQ